MSLFPKFQSGEVVGAIPAIPATPRVSNSKNSENSRGSASASEPINLFADQDGSAWPTPVDSCPDQDTPGRPQLEPPRLALACGHSDRAVYLLVEDLGILCAACWRDWTSCTSPTPRPIARSHRAERDVARQEVLTLPRGAEKRDPR